MQNRHYKVWPKGRPYELPPMKTTVFENLVLTAGRYPDHPAIIYYDAPYSYSELLEEVLSLAGYLREYAGVEKDTRVMLFHAELTAVHHELLRDPGL